jgi:hypothetical protein
MSVFEREFYIFPCLHAFHRECVWNQLKDYKSQDPLIKAKLDKVRQHFAEIEGIKGTAEIIKNE